MSSERSFSSPALVIKRVNTGEYDRVVTVLTPEYGKLVAVAKGARRITSSQRANLEPGCVIQGFFVVTKGMPILTQTRIVADNSACRAELAKIRQLSQVLEIVDRMFVEELADAAMYEQVVRIVSAISQDKAGTAKQGLNVLIEALGYPKLEETDHTSIISYVAELIDRPIRSFEYLRVPVG